MANQDETFRPNPDQLLSVIDENTRRESLGRLKIFLGMSAGVGKTYAMLKAAQELRNRGTDVVIAVVETHGRQETEELLKGLEILPRRSIEHRNITVTEMDLDAVLKRKPQVVLVDELAHTNAPNSRHSKRYLDVLEILKAGINVYTTINIQHIESRVDMVRDIVRVPIKETVPDSVFDQADEVVLIDLAPEELLKRLKEGKVYRGERAELASENFFQKGNLTALREMALRLAAERVDRELRDFKVLHGIEESWKSTNRLMVSVGANRYAEALIRWTRRLADMIDATWIGVNVDDGHPYTEEEKQYLAKNLSLIHQLGGELVSTEDTDPVQGIIRVARQNSVTQIIVGRSERSYWWNLINRGSIVNRIAHLAPDIDIYIVSSSRNTKETQEERGMVRRIDWPWFEAGKILTIFIVSWFLAALLMPFIGYFAVGILFLLAVNVSALFISTISTFILAAIFSCLHIYFFIPPTHTFVIKNFEDFMILSMFFIVAAITSNLTSRLAKKEKILNNRQKRTLALYHLTRDLALARSVSDLTHSSLVQMKSLFEQELAILLPAEGSRNTALSIVAGSTFFLDDKEMAVASWVFSNGRPAGRFTDTLSGSRGSYFPLKGRESTVGVMGIQFDKEDSLDPDRTILIETFSKQIATALEREIFHEKSLHRAPQQTRSPGDPPI